jgi:hypothetical protein
MIYPLQIPHGLSAALNTVLPPARADRNGQDDDAGAPDVGKNHNLADGSVPVTTANHLTQQPHVKNQAAERVTHRRHRLRRARRQYPIGPPYVFAIPVGRRQHESGSASFGISARCPRLAVVFATLAVLRATAVQTPTANPIVAALAKDPVTTHLD